MRYATGILTYNRPLHTALTLAYALMNKSADNYLHVFYGTYLSASTPSKALCEMLTALRDEGFLKLHYMPDDKPQNTQGNVDNLMLTLTSIDRYDCFIKIDDDVIIGKGSDDIMASIMLKLESEDVYMVMGQVVREHLNRRSPFSWETNVLDHRVVQRARRACPMETYTAVSKNMLPMLRKSGTPVSAGNSRGTYGVYTKNITAQGHKVCLVLDPAIQMQHIGLTTTIDESGASRSWAPARSWNPVDEVIKVPPFDFDKWEKAHTDSTVKDVTLEMLEDVRGNYPEQYKSALDIIAKSVTEYTPGSGDVELPPDPKRVAGGGPPQPQVRRREVRARQLGARQPAATRQRATGAVLSPEPVHIDVQKARRKQAERAAAQDAGVIRKLPTGQLVRRVRSPQSVVPRKGR